MVRRASLILLPCAFLGFISCSTKPNATESTETQPVQIGGTNRRGISINMAFVRCKVVEGASLNELSCKMMTKDPVSKIEVEVETLELGGTAKWTALEEKNGAGVAPSACVLSNGGLGISCLVAAEAAVPMDLIANAKLSDNVGRSVIEFDSKPYLPKTSEVAAFNQMLPYLKNRDTYSQMHLNVVSQRDYDLTKAQISPLAAGAPNGNLACADILAAYPNSWSELQSASKYLITLYANCKSMAYYSNFDGKVRVCEFLRAFSQVNAFKFVLKSGYGIIPSMVTQCQISTEDLTGDPFEFNNEDSGTAGTSTSRVQGPQLLVR